MRRNRVAEHNGSQTVDGYASYAETATRWPATRWFLAEGSTLGSFELYYLLQNPGAQATTVSIKYVFPSGPPCTVTKTGMPGRVPRST